MSAEGNPSNTNEIKDPSELVNVYKRKGYFDQKRKQLVEEFKSDESSSELDSLLTQLIDIKVAKDPSILVKNKGKISAIIQASLMSIADKPRRSSTSQNQQGKTDRSKRTTALTKSSESSDGSSNDTTTNNINNDEDVIIEKIHKLLATYANGHTSESDALNQTLTQQLTDLKSGLEQGK